MAVSFGTFERLKGKGVAADKNGDYLAAKRPEAEAMMYSKMYPVGTATGDFLRARAMQHRKAEYEEIRATD